MERFHQIEAEWIVALRGDASWNSFIYLFSTLGQEIAWGMIIVVYLCWGRRTGARWLLLYILNGAVIEALKLLFHSPRPFQVNDKIPFSGTHLSKKLSFGFPSGHTMNAVAAWGYAGVKVGKGWFWVAAALVISAVGFSRIYVGAHFISDVVGGLFFGALLLALWVWSEPKGARWVGSLSCGQQVVLAAVMAAAFTVAAIGAQLLGEGSLRAAQGGWFVGLERGAAFSGLMFGAGAGLALARKHLPFGNAGLWWQHILRVVIFVGGWQAIDKAAAWFIRPRIGSFAPLLSFSEKAALGFWLAFACPWIFLKWRLARTETSEDAERPRRAPSLRHPFP